MFRGSSNFDKHLEKCTSRMNMDPDWSSIMLLCDCIRSGETPPKYAVGAIKKKFTNPNPRVAFFALQVMESCVKNCGTLIHEEIATREFMEELRELVKQTNDESKRNKILEMIQTWGNAFNKSQKYKICSETFYIMKAEGWKFPPVLEADAMFEADTAPTWVNGTVCHRCRVEFGVVTRRHHCRACGQVFCGKCSSKSCVLPKIGIEKEVRVCDSCFEIKGPKDQASPGHKALKNVEELPAEYLASSLSQQNQAPKSGKSEAEINEEEEFQLALALSKSEAEEKEKSKHRSSLPSSTGQKDKNIGGAKGPPKLKDSEIDPELMRYLDRDYWESKEKAKNNPQAAVYSPERAPSSPTPEVTMSAIKVEPNVNSVGNIEKQRTLASSKEDQELDEFITTLKTQVEIFVNRMKSNSSRGRSITNDSSVQTLFMNTMSMHSQLLKYIQAQEDKRVYYEGLQDKLAQVKDARAALDALREEERERKRREAEEAERIRQAQMQEKLEVMRKKKQEYLQYQRQVALQRMQEQEREMMLRQEQVKQHHYAGGGPPQQPPMYGMWPPQGGPPNSMPYYPPPGPVPSYQDPYNMQMMSGTLPTMAPQQQPPYNQPGIPQQPPGTGMPQQVPASNPQQPPPPMQTNVATPSHPPQSVIPAGVPSTNMIPPQENPTPIEAELISFD